MMMMMTTMTEMMTVQVGQEAPPAVPATRATEVLAEDHPRAVRLGAPQEAALIHHHSYRMLRSMQIFLSWQIIYRSLRV